MAGAGRVMVGTGRVWQGFGAGRVWGRQGDCGNRQGVAGRVWQECGAGRVASLPL